MSDILSHSRDDLVELPCDCEPNHHPSAECAPAGRGKPFDTARVGHICGCSPYLCQTCNPRRSLIAAIRDVSAYRDLPMSYFELIRPRGNLVSLADERRRRAR